MDTIRRLIVRMATENREWGDTRIRGALGNLGHQVARGTLANVLKERGLEPAPERKKRTTWRELLAAHWDVLAAADFFTVEVWTPRGLTRFTVLVLIHLASRRVQIAGISAEPDGPWGTQLMRNATDAEDGFLRHIRFLIHDRDPLFRPAVRDTLPPVDVTPIRLPARSPNLNAYTERFVRTIKDSCLERMVLIGEGSLRRAVREFVAHYHHERNHQGLDNRRILPLSTATHPAEPYRGSALANRVIAKHRGLLVAERPRAACQAARMDWARLETSRLKRLLTDVATVDVEPQGTFRFRAQSVDSLDNRQRAEPVHQGSVGGLAGPRSLNVGQPRAAGTRRVRVPMLPFSKVPLGTRAISTVCARSVVSCLKSLRSGVICTSLNQTPGSVRLDPRLVDRHIRGSM